MSISIIIPVRNEEMAIGPCLDALSGCRDIEIVLVDGGSTDQTAAQIMQRGYTPISSRPGRGTQQDTGARKATGDILLFLHCDTRLPPDFAHHVKKTLQLPGVSAGAFQLAIDAQGRGFRLIEFGANLRSRLLNLPYGDQALFMKKELYFAAGGFPKQPIMEDVELVTRLKKLGRIVTTSAAVSTSARRWQQQGLFLTTMINQLMMAGRQLGISPERLARWYYRRRLSG